MNSNELKAAEFLRRACEIAAASARSALGGPFGTLVTKNGEILAEGSNLVTASNDPTAHAEIVAIRAACARLASFQLLGCELYCSCEPCPMCMAAIYWARPASVYFAATAASASAAGFDDAFIARELCLPASARRIPIRRIALPEASLPFEQLKLQPRKTPY